MISICERCKRLILGMELDKCDDCQKWICPDCMATKKGPVYPRLCQTVSHGTTQRIGNIYEEREYERRIDYDEEDEEEAYYNEFGYHRSYSER